jgi:hypothetical protein
MKRRKQNKMEKVLSSALTDVFNTLEIEMDKEYDAKKRCKK